MNSHHKTDAGILARCKASKGRNFHLKYIALKDRRKNKSEPSFTKSGENTKLCKPNHKKVNKASVIANHHVINKSLQFNQNHPYVEKKSPNVVKPAIHVKNVSNVQKGQKIEFVAHSVTKRASMISKQKIKSRSKHGFTEKIVSMWHYAKSFLGLSNSNLQNTQNDSVENKKSKHSLPVKPIRTIYVAKKPLIHYNYKDLKESKNVSVNQRYDKNIKKRKIVIDDIETHLVLSATKVNKINPNIDLQYENNSKFNKKVKIELEKPTVLKEKPKKDITIRINTNGSLQQQSRVNVEANETERIEEDKQMVLKDKAVKDTTFNINTNRPLREILTNANSYKSTFDGTITIEIKNEPSNVPKDNKQIQPQTLNVNCANETLDIHKNAVNCDKKVLTLPNTCNVKHKNNAELTTRSPSKISTNNVKKPLSKVKKIQNNLNKKKQPLVKELKKRQKIHHQEDTTGQRSCKRHHHHKTKHSHKHSCGNHTIGRKCSNCKGYISTDNSEQGKAYHSHHKDKYDYKERCRTCKKRVTCLYHHNKKNHKHDRNHHEKKSIEHHKEVKSSKKHPTPKKNRSFHNSQKKKRTLTVCTNSRTNSFKNKKLKRSVTYIPAQMKPSTSKILPEFKNSHTYNSIPHVHKNFKRSNSSKFRNDSDRQAATKVWSWWYLHYALNAIRQNDEIEENNLITHGEFSNVYEAVSKVNIDSDDSSSNENWNENFKVRTSFPRHPNFFADEESIVSENIYPNSSLYSSIHNFEDMYVDSDSDCQSTDEV